MMSGTPSTTRLASFRLGEWLIEPKACRVSRGDTVEKLRPQLVDLLLCLARHPGQIVLRDEILREVWPGQFIAESGLSRCVAELRQILRDDAQQPQFIETILKRGYRLIAPVVWLEDATADASPGQLEPSDATRPDAADTPSPPAPPAPRVRPRRWSAFAWVAAGLFAVTACIAAIFLATRSPARVLTERDTVLLADVRNTTRDKVFDDSLRLALAVNLEQAPFLRLLSQDAVRSALVRAGRSADERVVGPIALDVCRREGAAVLLAGSIAPLGSRYVVGIEATNCATGESLGHALEEAASREQVLTALERAATGIRRRLGESRESLGQHDVPLVRATTPSLEALEALTQGDVNRDHARLNDALLLYRQATQMDPTFALAWARRGAAAWNLDLAEEAIPAFSRAFELRDRVSQPERFYIEAHYYRLVTRDPEKTVLAYQAWKRMYPGSAVPPTNLASILAGTLGQYDAAIPEGREAVRLAPYSSLAARALIRAYRGSGRIDEARAAAAAATNHGIDDAILHSEALNLALLEGDAAAIEREVRWTSTDPVAALYTTRLRAAAAMGAGHLREGRRLWMEALARAEELGPPRRIADVRLFQAEAEVLVGDTRAARVAIEAALAADTRGATGARAAIAFALLGDVPRARALIDANARQEVIDPAAQKIWLPLAEALAASAQQRTTDAMARLKLVARFERGSDFGLAPLGVRALVQQAARQSVDAAAAFDDLIHLRSVDPASPWVAFARLQLGRALRDAGDNTKALAAYDAFLESWKTADPDAPLLKAARLERTAVASR